MLCKRSYFPNEVTMLRILLLALIAIIMMLVTHKGSRENVLKYQHIIGPWSKSYVYDTHMCSCPNQTRFYPKTSLLSMIQKKSHCSERATSRGPHQRVIGMSLFGPTENAMFSHSASISFLRKVLAEMGAVLPNDFILRIYHDQTITQHTVCEFECSNTNIDFCALPSNTFIPPKIWRFLPVGDPFVDVMMSRDLDSVIIQRERAAIDEWLSSNKSLHAMRDHPQHGIPMLGGMWGLRTERNRTFAQMIYDKILNASLVVQYGGRGDQRFLSHHVWVDGKHDAIVHDSYHCRDGFGQKSVPFPTQRVVTGKQCFVACIPPCCSPGNSPAYVCPIECRPPNHLDWIYC